MFNTTNPVPLPAHKACMDCLDMVEALALDDPKNPQPERVTAINFLRDELTRPEHHPVIHTASLTALRHMSYMRGNEDVVDILTDAVRCYQVV